MREHDPRIVALAKDPRTQPVLLSIVESSGALCRASSAVELAAFEAAVVQHGLDFRDPLGSELLAYVRDVADQLVRDEHELQRLRRELRGAAEAIRRALEPEPTAASVAALVVAVLRGDPCNGWPAADACEVTDALVEAELLTPDEGDRPLEPTRLGRAVQAVLEQRLREDALPVCSRRT
jgi:hypothetical protein